MKHRPSRPAPTTPRPAAGSAGRAISRVMTRLGDAIASMDLPAIEKISEAQVSTPFHVLIATMLSAQTRDPVTHDASMRLFSVAPTPETLARLNEARIAELIFPVSFYRNKARHVRQTAGIIAGTHGGRVPRTMGELLLLPGVGRKTANLVLIVAHRSAENICVDTHVHRIANRLGWVATKTPEQTEEALYRVAPRRWWAAINLHLVTWGQNVCRPVYPLCDVCAIRPWCARIGVTRTGKPAKSEA